LLGSPDINAAHGGATLQHPASAVQRAFCGDEFWPPLPTFRRDPDLWKIATDRMPVRGFNAGANGHVDVWHEIDRDVADSGFQNRVGLFVRSNEFGGNCAGAGLHMGRRDTPQLDVTAAGLSADRSTGGSELQAAGTGFHAHPAANLAKFDTAATGGRLNASGALVDANAAAPSFERCLLLGRHQRHVAATCFRSDLAFY